MAQIHLSQNNFKLANQSLEVGLSYNFEVNCKIYAEPVPLHYSHSYRDNDVDPSCTLVKMNLLKSASTSVISEFKPVQYLRDF